MVLCHTGARTFRRTIIPSCLFAGTDAVLSLGPSPGWREKLARRATACSPHGGHYGVVVDFSGPSVIIGARPLMWSGGTVVRSTWEALATVCCYAREGGPTVCVRPPWSRSEPGRVGHSLGPPRDDRGRGWGQSRGVDPPQSITSSTECPTPENRKSLSTSSSGWEIYLPTSYIPGCSIALGDRK